MSFLTEYFDEYRTNPIKKTKMCRPELRWAKFEGKWLDPKVGKQDKEWTDEEMQAFIKETMRSLRGRSTYYNSYCAHHTEEWTDEEMQAFIKETMRSLRGRSTYYNSYCAHHTEDYGHRPFVPRVKKLRPCTESEEKIEEEVIAPPAKLAMKDTELMKVAKELYEYDLSTPTLQPLPTTLRIYGYVRPQLYHTGISDYQNGIARLAYETIRDDRIPPYHAHNGCRPRWGLPPEGQRQPELDGAPFDGERLY
ncbi:hypothetical protein PYW07_006766 [Mythimna separata]|uniref:Uncharacterized protein n=1 Tax=Mythimna separata TaxID=271217 RepID=A0AAD7YVF0_MYTSE|nr:hypothetical protein PYW07_006766 [Mythimna separata]